MLTKGIDDPFYQSEAFYVTHVTVELSRNQYAAAREHYQGPQVLNQSRACILPYI
jgi:hypothetical protein